MDHTDRHIQAMRDLLVAEHEATIAEVQQWADEATDPWYRKLHQDHAARLRAMSYPWEETRSAA